MRDLVGLDRPAAVKAFADFLDEGRFDVNQIQFIHLIVDELTKIGVIEPRRLFRVPLHRPRTERS